MNKKKYKKPIAKITKFNEENIITASQPAVLNRTGVNIGKGSYTVWY